MRHPITDGAASHRVFFASLRSLVTTSIASVMLMYAPEATYVLAF